MSVPHIPGMTDEDLMTYALREAQLILAAHIFAGTARDLKLQMELTGRQMFA
jgi:hypothetical protein